MDARLKDTRTEKAVEHDGDRLMETLGFEVVRLSQPRRSMVTIGLPDRRYYHRAKQLATWWEAKRVGGTQSAAQREFQAMVEAVGEEIVVGTDAALLDWARAKGLVL